MVSQNLADLIHELQFRIWFEFRDDSIISSFMFAHLTSELRSKILVDIFKSLNSNGRFGLFSARGEIAPSFETKDEINAYLLNAGFQNIQIDDVSDINRITTAIKKWGS